MTNQQKPVLLIVDDNMSFVERMIGLLDDQVQPGNITVASDYEEAFRYFLNEKPDVILLDINLPGKNGIEILKKIRLSGLSCKVIMITNHFDEYYRDQCKELGADHFLDKSNDFARVPAIISRYRAELDHSMENVN